MGMGEETVLEIERMLKQYPLLQEMIFEKPVLWSNPDYVALPIFPIDGLNEELINGARERFNRFQPILKSLFNETSGFQGVIQSPVMDIPEMKRKLECLHNKNIKGRLMLKRDDLLAIAGSIKARGGFHEVLSIAEKLAIDYGVLKEDYNCLISEKVKQIFNHYHIVVGSTGNLGLSIGMIGSALGFRVSVHMSNDAKDWKKKLLRENGVNVVEHLSDYSVAVEKARAVCLNNPKAYFVDDENSQLLFAGYSVAALELKQQFEEDGVVIDSSNPLYVYLPCGVGGGPGGITFGLKSVFGEHVHCYFAEPIQSPAMLLGLMTKHHNHISVYDIGLRNQTEADGLAVGRPSKFVGKLMEKLLAGIYTISDQELLQLMKDLYDTEDIFLEPSALAGMKGPALQADKEGVHVVWATGGSIIPDLMKKKYLQKAAEL